MMTVRRMSMAFVAVALLALPLTGRAADVNKYLPDDTEIVAVLNIKQIVDSPAAKKHNAIEELKKKIKENADVSKLLESVGIDPFKDLTSITVGAPAIDMDPKATIVAEGNFDVAKLEAAIPELAKKHADKVKVSTSTEGGKTIFELKAVEGNEPPGYFAFVDKNTAMLSSDKKNLKEAFERAAGTKKASPNKELVEKLSKTDTNQSFYALVLASTLAKSPLGQQDEAKKQLDKMEFVSVGMTLANDFKFHITMMTKGANDAKDLLENVKMGLEQAKQILPAFAGQQKELAPAVDVLNAIKVSTEGNAVVMKGEVSQELLEKKKD